MGLFRWTVLKIAGFMGLLKPRRYRVTLFGESLGTYFLPRGHHMANPIAEDRPVLTRPFRSSQVEERYYLYWLEPKADGGAIMIQWMPETPDEIESAKRFFNGAHGLRPNGTPDPARQPPLPTRTTEELRLIAAVRANPDAAQPYLDYAKWLSAKKDTYGEYLHMTCEIVKLAEGSPEREKLEEKRFQYAQRHGAKWIVALSDLGFFPGFSFAHPESAFYAENWFGKNGVIEEFDLHCEANVFPHNVAKFFHAAPFMRSLSINNMDITVADVGAVPQMAQIESLGLMIGGGTADDYRTFAESPNLGGLRNLRLSSAPNELDAITELASAKWLLHVRSLTLPVHSLSDDGLEVFAASPNVANLRVFDLALNYLTDRGALALCHSPHLTKLTTYSLFRSQITSATVAAIPQAVFAPVLESLTLSDCPLDLAGAQALAAGRFPALRSVAFSGGEWPHHDGSTRFTQLCGDSVLGVLIGAPWFRNLERLSAHSCGLTDASVQAIAAVGFIDMRVLGIRQNQITDAGVAALVRSNAASKLKNLSLSDNPFGTVGTKAIAEANLPDLEELDLIGVKIGPAGAKALAASPQLKKLKKLGVSDEFVGLAGREALLKRFTDQVVMFY